jgi:hypothetical protein
MEENLVGYLLKSLDDETHQQVEASLRKSAELRSRLELLERALAPLAADAEPPQPRPGLVLATLSRIAEYQCRKLPPAPPPPPSQTTPAARSWLRRPDALVAALLLIVLGGISASALVHLWRDYNGRAECQRNLFLIWGGLQQYCDAHNGYFPRVEEKGPRSFAGMFVPVLCDNGMLSPDVTLRCPAEGERRVVKCRSLRDLEELYERAPDEFRAEARKQAGSYAYTLGYRDADGNLHGLRCDAGDRLPIMADRLALLSHRNSENHGGDGQNVLHLGGSVFWRTQRTVGINGDDIFLNWDNQVLPGKAREDTVLGPSDSSPSPRD